MNPISYIKRSLRDRRLNFNRNAAVERGEFLYYIVLEDTNLRNQSESGEVVIYSSRGIAEEECEWLEEVVSVAEYNEIFGRFMEK